MFCMFFFTKLAKGGSSVGGCFIFFLYYGVSASPNNHFFIEMKKDCWRSLLKHLHYKPTIKIIYFMSENIVIIEIDDTKIQAIKPSEILNTLIDKINGHSRQVA